MNWLTGLVLLLTISLAFTGQLLRWNQDTYWDVYVMAEQIARAISGQLTDADHHRR